MVLELGSGTGAVGIWIAAAQPHATVILSDLAETMPNLSANIAANNLESQCIARELAFGEDLRTFHAGALGNIDVIIASDCQYSYLAKFEWQPFVATLASALPGTKVYISLQERYGATKERLEPFFNALSNLGNFIELVHVPALPEKEYPLRCFYLCLDE